MPDRRTLASIVVAPALLVLGASVGYGIAIAAGRDTSYLPVVSGLLALVAALSVPVWQIFVLNAPKLTLEIYSIQRKVSETALVSLNDDPDLWFLVLPEQGASEESLWIKKLRTEKSEATLQQIEDLFARAKQHQRELPSQIRELDEIVRILNDLKEISPYEFEKLNDVLPHPLSVDVPANERVNALKELYIQLRDAKQKRLNAIQAAMPLVERRVESVRKHMIANSSYFTISASLFNSGKSNSAIKVPTLLRVWIGVGNYIDLTLSLKDFEANAEIAASGTKVVTFKSREVSDLPQADRDLINTYWGQSVSTRLYVEDIHGEIHESNEIAFAAGLYQRLIYDRLAAMASLKRKRRESMRC